MKIKRFLAASLPEAKAQILQELGEDAVVLSSRQVKRKGILGWLGFSQVEVTAAVDEVPAATAESRPSEQKLLLTDPAAPWEGLQRELTETKRMLEAMASRLARTQGRSAYPEPMGSLYSRLQATGLEAGFLTEVMEELMSDLRPAQPADVEQIEGLVRNLLEEKLSRYILPPVQAGVRQVICLIGPTGVGKTTTIAKLAANAVLRQQQRVAFVTFDTYRIAAVEQLRTYGDILTAPVQVALTPAEMRQTLNTLSDYDIVFVDSVGRSQQNKMQLSELKAFLEAVDADEVYLTLSATTQYEVMLDVIESYRIMQPTALLFTKLDEGRCFGPIINLLLKTGLPAAFFTNGQDVPDDLIRPCSRDLVNLLLGE